MTFLVTLSAVPVIVLLVRAFLVSRNVAYWDEIDSALALLLRLERGAAWPDVVTSLMALTNEHRTFTSRLLFVVSYWLTGTINFTVIGVIGNLFICAAAGLLIATAGSTPRKMRMLVLLAFLLFQLEHYENFFWSGSSIDHFQVVLLAAGAFVAVAQGTRPGFAGAGLCALLATLTLAHGLIVWPVGAGMLIRERRWRHLSAWLTLGAVASWLYFQDFRFNPGHHIGDFSAAGIGHIVQYWLTLLGAPLALGANAVSPWLGALLLALLGRVVWRGAPGRERIALPLAAWAVAALFLVAIGRANVAENPVSSRYYILGGLAWALVLFMELEAWDDAMRPNRLLARTVPVLALFNATATHVFSAPAAAWAEYRDCAALSFTQYGVDGRGPFALHPAPAHATAMLNQAENCGVYRMTPMCPPTDFPSAQPSARVAYFVDELTVTRHSMSVAGWAAIPGQRSRRGQLSLILRQGEETHVFQAVPGARPDVVDAFNEPRWKQSGFRVARHRHLLPVGRFQIGFLITGHGKAEYIMTEHLVLLVGDGEARLATSQ